MRSVTEAERMQAGAELHAKYRREFLGGIKNLFITI